VARSFKGRPHLTRDLAFASSPHTALTARPRGKLQQQQQIAVTTLRWDLMVYRDQEPNDEQRRQGSALCPKLTALYRIRFPELATPGTANKWAELVGPFGDLLKERTKNNLVFLVGAGHVAWREATLNWMVAAHKLRIYNYVLLSLDSEMHQALSRVGAPSFLPPDPAWASALDPQYRWRLISETLQRGVSVVYCDPSAVLLRNPIELLAASTAHIVAGDLRPFDAVDERGATTKQQKQKHAGGTSPSGNSPSSSLLMRVVEDGGRIDPDFLYLRTAGHTLGVIPKIVAGVKPLDRESPIKSVNNVLNGGSGGGGGPNGRSGFVTWSGKALRDPLSRSDQRVVQGSTASGLRIHLWQDATVRRLGCAQKDALRGVMVLNCVTNSFNFGQSLDGANEAQVEGVMLSTHSSQLASPWLLFLFYHNLTCLNFCVLVFSRTRSRRLVSVPWVRGFCPLHGPGPNTRAPCRTGWALSQQEKPKFEVRPPALKGSASE
jgi:hypothetical protein